MVSLRLAVAAFTLLGFIISGLSAASLLSLWPATGVTVAPSGLDSPAAILALLQLGAGVFLAASALAWWQPKIGTHLVFALLATTAAWSLQNYGFWWLAAAMALCFLASISGLVAAIRTGLAKRQQTPTTLNTFYQDAIASRRIRVDEQQQALVAQLDERAAGFSNYQRQRSRPWGFLHQAPVGIYLCGPAGRGKTFLLDAFYQTLPVDARQRYHFHQVMSRLLTALHKTQGKPRAVRLVARKLAKPGSLVVLDELNLLDITGTRLLLRLLDAWWRQGNVVCISSNMTIDAVFAGVALADDERRQACVALHQHCPQWVLDHGQDYRANKLSGADLYQYPMTKQTPNKLQTIVARLAEGPVANTAVTLAADNLEIPCVQNATGIAWFTFNQLCETPLGYRQYLELVNQFPVLIISDVPHLTAEDPARRFAWLVELIYDAKKRLIVAAQVPLDELFAGALSSTGEQADFGKITSRLKEMQSSEYNYVLATDA